MNDRAGEIPATCVLSGVWPLMNERFYFLPGRRVLTARLAIGLLLVGWLTLFVVQGVGPIWFLPIQVAIMVWVVWSMFLSEIRPSETKDGFRTRSSQSLLWKQVAWHDIDRFAQGRRNALTGLSLACIVSKDGAVTPIMAISAGRTVTWDGGQTDDIVGELNARLDGWRRELGLTT